MIEWWNSLDLMNKILWAITLSASLIFIVQTVMTFLGVDGDGDFDTDADAGDLEGSGMNLLTFRNFVNFFLGFGWSSVLLGRNISSTSLVMIISIIVGVLLVVLVMLLFKWLGSMQQNSTIDVFRSACGCQGVVYLTIPAQRSGEGKVQITINDSVREYGAVTDGDELRTGQYIQVVDVVNANTLLVEAMESTII